MTHECCDEYADAARLSRRALLGGMTAVAGATTMFGDAVLTTASASTVPARSVLVVLSMRGAVDGLSMTVPYNDPIYAASRPKIAIPRDRLLNRDGTFGFHPAMKALMPLWTNGTLATVQATGLPMRTRSHFAAMEELEDADPGSDARTGWLNRLISLPDSRTSALQGFNLGTGVAPLSLQGPAPYMNSQRAELLSLVGAAGDPGRMRSLRAMWGKEPTAYAAGARIGLSAVNDYSPVLRTTASPRNGARYPTSDLGTALSGAARIIRSDVGVEVLTIDAGGWDMHAQLGSVDYGQMTRQLEDFSTSLAAFFADLGALAGKVTVVTISEFGRRVEENANKGLDHGWGNVMLLAGAGVRGGRHYGTFRPLQAGLDSDVEVTTDYRSVLSEVVRSRFNASTAQVFPGFSPESLGVMRMS